MQKTAIAILAGIFTAATVTGVSAQPAPGHEVGTRPYCNGVWREKVENNTTGGETRYDFMKRCVVEPRGAYLEYGAGAALAAGLAVALVASHQGSPVSP